MVANEMIERTTELMATCQRHFSSAARRLRSAMAGRGLDSRFSSGRYIIPIVAKKVRRLGTGCSLRNGFPRYSMRRIVEGEDEEEEEEEETEERVWWKRTILMGMKCQPLEFSGAILDDSKRWRLAPPSRTPLRSLLASADE